MMSRMEVIFKVTMLLSPCVTTMLPVKDSDVTELSLVLLLCRTSWEYTSVLTFMISLKVRKTRPRFMSRLNETRAGGVMSG